MAAAWVSLARCNQELLVNSSEGKLKPKKNSKLYLRKARTLPHNTLTCAVKRLSSAKGPKIHSTEATTWEALHGAWDLAFDEFRSHTVCGMFCVQFISTRFTQQKCGPANAELVRTKAEEHNSTQRSEQMYGVEKTALPLKQLQHLVSGAVEM